MKKPNKKTLRNKADRLIQELGRKIFKKCEVCGDPMDCLHHFVSKGNSSYLRYYWPNLIPICTSCHVKIELRKAHLLTARIVLNRGEDWLKDLRQKAPLYVKTNVKYYKDKIEELKKGIK